jgi:hypothetical protein
MVWPFTLRAPSEQSHIAAVVRPPLAACDDGYPGNAPTAPVRQHQTVINQLVGTIAIHIAGQALKVIGRR